MTKASFEEACAIAATIMNRKNFLSMGVKQTCDVALDALAEVGWTLGDMNCEARRRTLEKIKKV